MIVGNYRTLRFVESVGPGKSALLAGATVVGAVAIGSDVFQVAGIQGTWQRLAFIVVFGVLLVSGLSLTVLVRWWLLYRALRDFVRRIPITKDTILVSGGPGGAIAAGMLSKVAQESLTLDEPPSLLVIDTEYDRDQNVLCGRGTTVTIDQSRAVLCVASHVGTGRLLEEMKRSLKLPPTTKTFALVHSPECRQSVDFALHSGRRNILPWPRAGSIGKVIVDK